MSIVGRLCRGGGGGTYFLLDFVANLKLLQKSHKNTQSRLVAAVPWEDDAWPPLGEAMESGLRTHSRPSRGPRGPRQGPWGGRCCTGAAGGGGAQRGTWLTHLVRHFEPAQQRHDLLLEVLLLRDEGPGQSLRAAPRGGGGRPAGPKPGPSPLWRSRTHTRSRQLNSRHFLKHPTTAAVGREPDPGRAPAPQLVRSLEHMRLPGGSHLPGTPPPCLDSRWGLGSGPSQLPSRGGGGGAHRRGRMPPAPHPQLWGQPWPPTGLPGKGLRHPAGGPLGQAEAPAWDSPPGKPVSPAGPRPPRAGRARCWTGTGTGDQPAQGTSGHQWGGDSCPPRPGSGLGVSPPSRRLWGRRLHLRRGQRHMPTGTRGGRFTPGPSSGSPKLPPARRARPIPTPPPPRSPRPVKPDSTDPGHGRRSYYRSPLLLGLPYIEVVLVQVLRRRGTWGPGNHWGPRDAAPSPPRGGQREPSLG